MRITSILLLLVLVIGLNSCDKAPINGKLDGMWQLMTIEHKDGEITECQRIYYSIQLHLIEIKDKGSHPQSYIGWFTNEGDEITIGDFRHFGNEECHATLNELEVFGLYQLTTRFRVEKLSNSHLTLEAEGNRLHFRKF